MSTVDTSSWNPDADLNTAIEGIPLNSDAGIAQTWKVIAILMAAMKGDVNAVKAMISVMEGASASADGASGLVPQPLAGDQDKVLKGDGTWDALDASDIPSIDASKITSGTIDLARLPAGALERLVTVADQTARYALTTADVQLGDTVKQIDTGVMYIVVDTSKLGQSGGYVEFTAGSATSVPWSGVTDKPSTFTPSSHTHGSITNDGKLSTASRAVVTDGNKSVTVSSVTATELGYLSGVTSAVQTQLDAKVEASDLCNWQKTSKAVSVTLKPVPESDLEPVVDFLFTEVPPASGDKGPDNPSTITGVSSITVTRCETVGVDSTDYTINLGSTYYGGTLDVASGVMTVTHLYKTIINVSVCGEPSNGYVTPYLWPSTYGDEYRNDIIRSIVTCSELPAVNSSSFPERIWLGSLNAGNGMRPINIRLSQERVGVTSGQTANERRNACNAYLSENPIHIVVGIVPSQTVQLTPTQILSLTQQDKYTPRLNTVYTDASAVQVGYQRFFDEKRLATLEARIEALENANA